MSLIDRINAVLRPLLESEKVELIDLVVKGKSSDPTIKVFVDTASGIDLNHCAEISRLLSDELEFQEFMPEKYRLEVSSPGLDRPLRNVEDFRRNMHREVEIISSEESVQKAFKGKIVQVSEEAVEIMGKQERRVFPISAIKYGRILLPW